MKVVTCGSAFKLTMAKIPCNLIKAAWKTCSYKLHCNIVDSDGFRSQVLKKYNVFQSRNQIDYGKEGNHASFQYGIVYLRCEERQKLQFKRRQLLNKLLRYEEEGGYGEIGRRKKRRKMRRGGGGRQYLNKSNISKAKAKAWFLEYVNKCLALNLDFSFVCFALFCFMLFCFNSTVPKVKACDLRKVYKSQIWKDVTRSQEYSIDTD